MDRLRERRDRFAIRRLDLVLAVTAVILLAATAAFLADNSLSFVLVDRSADVAINALTVLAAGSLAALALARYREAGRLAGLFQASAFLLIAWVALLNVAVTVFKVEDDFGLSLGRPEQLPLYVSSISRLVAGALLVVGGAAAVNMFHGQPRTRRTMLVPIVAFTVALVVLYLVREQISTFDTLLPPFIGPVGIKQMITEPRFAGAMPDVTSIALLIQAISAALFLVGVILYRRSYLRDGPVADGYLAVAMLIGAFAEIHFYFYPGVYGGLVTTSEALRLAFFVVLFAGINAESRSDLRALRSAYAALDRLRMSEAERATLEERTRLARELHDGLSQDLWFAKLKHERLVQYVPDDQKELAQEVTQAIDSAIAEAKQAVVTMRAAEDRERPLEELMSRTIDDFAARSGVRADFSAADLPMALPPRIQVEALRVLQEALTNVRKHADATVVRVAADFQDSTLHVTIVDNGRGFRPEETSGGGLGVQGMKERARLMGGDLRVVSEPSGGTSVDLTVPVRDNVSAT
ncbi:MAG TPA: sensor histidine kinase [Candidatus Limnocylindrales bacterium]